MVKQQKPVTADDLMLMESGCLELREWGELHDADIESLFDTNVRFTLEDTGEVLDLPIEEYGVCWRVWEEEHTGRALEEPWGDPALDALEEMDWMGLEEDEA